MGAGEQSRRWFWTLLFFHPMTPSRQDSVLNLQRAGRGRGHCGLPSQGLSEKNGILTRNRSDRWVPSEASAQSGEGQLCDLPAPSSEFSASLTGPGHGASAACQRGCVPSPRAPGTHPTPGQLSSSDKLAAVAFETFFGASLLSN